MLNLLFSTPESWLETVCSDFNSLLNDHANCEQKASAMAISLINSFPEKPELTEILPDLAMEELIHFSMVLKLMKKRNIPFSKPEPSTYAKSLKKFARNSRQDYYIDMLLISALNEARSCERFDLLRKGCPDEEIRLFYDSLFESEARHYTLYLNLALKSADRLIVFSRLDELLQKEAELVKALPITSKMF